MDIYSEELEKFRKVSRAYRIQAKMYREGNLLEETYLAIRKEFALAQEALDRAEKLI